MGHVKTKNMMFMDIADIANLLSLFVFEELILDLDRYTQTIKAILKMNIPIKGKTVEFKRSIISIIT